MGINDQFIIEKLSVLDKATDASLPSENWGLNMEICDVINETEDGYVT